ncbi:MAG: hypothetical protein AAGJ54_01430 [Planctomycetota bacterium]
MIRRPLRTIKHAERALDTAAPEDVAAIARRLLDAADSLRADLPSASRNDPIGVIERVLARRSDRASRRAERSAASVFQELAPADQDDLMRRLGPRRRDVILSLLNSDTSSHRGAALSLLAASGDWSLVPHAARLIGSDNAAESSAAVDAIASLASSLDSGAIPHGLASLERAVAAVLDAAADLGVRPGSARAGDRDVLELALLMLTPLARSGRLGPAPGRWLGEAPQALELALRAALRRLRGPAGAARAMELVVEPVVRRAAVERLGEADLRTEIAGLLHRAHLGRRPLRRSAIRSRLDPSARRCLLTETESCVQQPAGTTSAPAVRGLPDWVEVLGVPEDQLTRTLEQLLACSDAATRLSAVLAGNRELRIDQSLDAHPSVALAAAIRIALPSRRNPAQALADAKTRDLLSRSQHEAVRRLADRMPLRGGAHPASLVAFRSRLLRDRPAAIAELAIGIEAGDAAALEMAARVECADDLLPQLESALNAENPRVAARAASALAWSASSAADSMLAARAEHREPRVRANIIEAAAFRARRWKRSPLILRLDDPHHRPAVNSVRAQLLAGSADASTAQRVCDLVSSAEPHRRAAGLWLTERSASELKPVAGKRWAEIAARVADSARNAESGSERVRATRCVRRMLAASVAAV